MIILTNKGATSLFESTRSERRRFIISSIDGLISILKHATPRKLHVAAQQIHHSPANNRLKRPHIHSRRAILPELRATTTTKSTSNKQPNEKA